MAELLLMSDRPAGRLRLRHAALAGNAALAARLRAQLAGLPGITSVEVRALTGSIILHHAPAMDRGQIMARIAEAVDRARKGGVSVDPPPAQPDRSRRGDTPEAPADPRTTVAWHSLSAEEVAIRLQADPGAGLTAAEAAARLARHGANVLPQDEPRSGLAILRSQFESLPVALLAGSAVVSIATGGIGDAVVPGWSRPTGCRSTNPP
ncbi:MAG: hypothetical protein IE927_14385 [Rhodobacterales bacterium]|nr:hypothetical protein [Rhodobacterales bacterium]